MALITEKAAAEMIGMSVTWLRNHRREKTGPKCYQFERAVRYRESDIEAWLEAHICRPGEGE